MHNIYLEIDVFKDVGMSGGVETGVGQFARILCFFVFVFLCGGCAVGG